MFYGAFPITTMEFSRRALLQTHNRTHTYAGHDLQIRHNPKKKTGKKWNDYVDQTL